MPKKLIGTVTSDSQDKTIIVSVTSRQTHPLYGKQYTVTRKYSAHDEANKASKGDRVEISESRPFSKTKTWKLDQILEAGHAEVEVVEEAEVAEVTGEAEKARKLAEKQKQEEEEAV